MFIIVLGQHVSILIETSSGSSKNTDPFLVMFKNALWDPKRLHSWCNCVQNACVVMFLLYNQDTYF